MTALPVAKLEWRAFGRVLPTLILGALCLMGLALILRGAVIPAKAVVAQMLLNRAFDQSLAEHRPVKPWPWADTAPVARISLARLGVSEIVLSGGTGQAMAFGPTLLTGRPQVVLMAAHRDTHFAFLKDVKRGDLIEVQSVRGEIKRYRMTGSQIVQWDRFAYPGNPARPLLGLSTCYPFGATAHGRLRYVAWAEEVSCPIENCT